MIGVPKLKQKRQPRSAAFIFNVEANRGIPPAIRPCIFAHTGRTDRRRKVPLGQNALLQVIFRRLDRQRISIRQGKPRVIPIGRNEQLRPGPHLKPAALSCSSPARALGDQGVIAIFQWQRPALSLIIFLPVAQVQVAFFIYYHAPHRQQPNISRAAGIESVADQQLTVLTPTESRQVLGEHPPRQTVETAKAKRRFIRIKRPRG